jgi:energy-coupling factor transport system ATP-binding protein
MESDLPGGKPQEIASLVGYVSQNPEHSFVADKVADELAFGMEQMGFDRNTMVRRVAEVAGLVGITDLVERDIADLSSGQQQRVAIAAALSGGQGILLLDEPTSSLDAASAVQTISLLRELANSGVCVLVVEHRFARLVDWVDSITELRTDGTACRISKDAARRLTDQLAGTGFATDHVSIGDRALGQVLLSADGLNVKYRDICAVIDAQLTVRAGEIVGLCGPNGSGKSSLLWALQGSLSQSEGQVMLAPDESVALLPSPASDLLFLPTVAAELAESDSLAQAKTGTTSALFTRFVGHVDTSTHPRDLSVGQQLSLAIAVQLSKGTSVLLLDEPTNGLDYRAKAELATILLSLSAAGHGIVMASHDEDFLSFICTRMLAMDAGRVG